MKTTSLEPVFPAHSPAEIQTCWQPWLKRLMLVNQRESVTAPGHHGIPHGPWTTGMKAFFAVLRRVMEILSPFDPVLQ